MLSLIEQVFFVLLSFSEFLATKCVSLNDKPCMIRHAIIDLNSIELKYYLFVIRISVIVLS